MPEKLAVHGAHLEVKLSTNVVLLELYFYPSVHRSCYVCVGGWVCLCVCSGEEGNRDGFVCVYVCQ